MNKTTPAQQRATNKYQKKTVKQINIKLNKKTDSDIIEILEKVENVQGFIKELIRASK